MKSHIVITATLVLALAGQAIASEETARLIYQKRQYENAMTRTQVEVAQYVINHIRASAAVAAQGGAVASFFASSLDSNTRGLLAFAGVLGAAYCLQSENRSECADVGMTLTRHIANLSSYQQQLKAIDSYLLAVQNSGDEDEDSRGARGKAGEGTSSDGRPVPIAVKTPAQSAEEFVRAYYQYLGQRDAQEVKQSWKEPPAELLTKLGTVESFRVNNTALSYTSPDVAGVWVEVDGKQQNEKAENWKGVVHLENVSGEWKIITMALHQTDTKQ